MRSGFRGEDDASAYGSSEKARLQAGMRVLRSSPHRASYPLRLPNLLNDAETLAELLGGAVLAGEWLDAFLLVAGLDQILEDALHEDLFSLGRIASRLRREAEGPLGRAAWRGVASTRAALWTLCSQQLRSSSLALCEQRAAKLAVDLADLLTGAPASAAGLDQRGLRESAARLGRELARLPTRVRRNPLRLPSAFRHLDMCPEDLRVLMDEVVERWPDPRRSVLVVGVRTAGSYLAPIAYSWLRAAGRRNLRRMTMRPGQRWLPAECGILRWARATGALVLVLDDPPNTWGTVATTADTLAAAGIKRESIVPVVQTFPTTHPQPAWLEVGHVVVMPWERYDIQRRLQPEAVKASLAELLKGAAAVNGVRRLSFDPHRGARAHVGALYEVELSFGRHGQQRRLIYAQGVGLGYFGTHALAVSGQLQPFLPTVYGVVDGLMFREWLPEKLRLSQADPPGDAAQAIVDYVRARAQAFPVDEDFSRRLKSRPSLWRGVGRFLARPLGRAQVLSWPLLQAGARELLRVTRPSVVDARTHLSSWFRETAGVGRLRKIGFAERAFSAFDTHCYDPVFDLAGAAASSDATGVDAVRFDQSLRYLYVAEGGEPVDPERWLIYQLVYLADLDIESEGSDPNVERRMSTRLQRYFSEVLLSDIVPAPSGQLCAIDLDGVLESSPLGISATNADGAMALRALHKHGYRPVIATGRSTAELRERCLHYRVAGGVAEYGAGIYVTADDRRYELLTSEERDLLDLLRSLLERMPDVSVDGSFQLAVRAYRLDRRGRRRALRDDQVEAALAGVGSNAVRAIQGEAQTDFMVQRVTKATGLEALAARLGVPANGSPWLTMAVGDTASDLPMLRVASHAFAPANADLDVREAGIEVLKEACQAGLATASARLVGHRPGACSVCREPDLPGRSRVLLGLLSAPDRSPRATKAAWAATTLARLAWHLGTSRGQGRGRRLAPTQGLGGGRARNRRA